MVNGLITKCFQVQEFFSDFPLSNLLKSGKSVCKKRFLILLKSLFQYAHLEKNTLFTRATCGSASLGIGSVPCFISMSRHVIKILQLHHRDMLCESESCYFSCAIRQSLKVPIRDIFFLFR